MKKKIPIFSIFICLLSIPFFRISADVESALVLFEQGNKSYEEGNFAEAIQQYDKILNLGVRNFKVFYNLGNAYFRQNHLGKSIVNYRRALLLEPRDEDALANLSFAKLFTLDKIEEQEISPFSNLLQWFLNLLSADEFALLASFSYALTMLFGILMIFKISKRYLRFAFLIFLICLAFFGSSLFAKIHFDSLKYGVVVIPEAQVRSGPGDDYILQFTGHEGLEFRVEEKSEEWYRISLPNGIKGWISVEAVEII